MFSRARADLLTHAALPMGNRGWDLNRFIYKTLLSNAAQTQYGPACSERTVHTIAACALKKRNEGDLDFCCLFTGMFVYLFV